MDEDRYVILKATRLYTGGDGLCGETVLTYSEACAQARALHQGNAGIGYSVYRYCPPLLAGLSPQAMAARLRTDTFPDAVATTSAYHARLLGIPLLDT